MSNHSIFSKCSPSASQGTCGKNSSRTSVYPNNITQNGISNTNNFHKTNQSKEKHSFLRKKSRQFLASSQSKNNLQHLQQKKITSINPISKSESQRQFGSFNRIKSLKNNFTPQLLNKINSNNKIFINGSNNISKIKTEGLSELGEESFENILKQKDILYPPESKINSKDLYKKTQSFNRTKIQSFQSILDRKELNQSKNNENVNSMNKFFTQMSSSKDKLNLPLKNNINESFLSKQSIQICPQLLYLYRTQHLISETECETFRIRLYSKGRKQLRYSDGTIQVYYNNGSEIKLTKWTNGDFKLIDGDKVSYWSEELNDFDQYFLD